MLERYLFPRKAIHSTLGEVIVHGFFQCGNLESGCDPIAVVELLNGKIETVNVDNLVME
ncbi:MAG: hypothetical protein PHO58_05820 [Bacilli bacterium]|nr:hypothetical protein [Bacilli bacterium]